MSPSIEYAQLSPMLIVFAAAVIGVLIEAFVSARARYAVQLTTGVVALVAALVAVAVIAPGSTSVAVMGSVVVDGPTLFLQGTILVISVLALLLVAERRLETSTVRGHDGPGATRVLPIADAFTPQASSIPGSISEREATAAGIVRTEVFPLTLFAVAGMMLFPASGDLLTMFVALEVFSLPLYLLCAMARRRRLLSQESALKYFLLGAFSSAFFLFGIAMLYGYAGTLSLGGIADAVASGDGSEPLVSIGTALVAVGLLFKVGAVPFHSWIPDVYQGAPTPVTAFMAAATKIAAFGAMLRIFYVALPDLSTQWRPVLSVIAIATVLVGAILAVTQSDAKRMLAYSSIAHTGFILTGLIAYEQSSLAATMFYLCAYGVSTLGAFAVVGLIRDPNGEVTDLSRWAGLGRRHPLAGSVIALFLLAFAGIPLTSGFVSKFAVFNAAWAGGSAVLVLVGVFSSAIAVFFYIRVIMILFFSGGGTEGESVRVATPSALTTVAVGTAAAVTIVLGIVPQPLLDLAEQAARFGR